MDEDNRDEIKQLRIELERLNNHRFVQVHNSMPRLLGFQLIRGLAFGLGTVLGASLLLSILAWSLAQIDFIPVIGDWAAIIADRIREKR
jgi:hypothetical protein